MSIFMYPAIDEEPWPTLGSQVCDFIEERFCHGPGDLLGQVIQLNEEQRGWVYRLYEVEPASVERRKNRVIVRELNPNAGKRRFQRCALSLRKGSSKTEFAAWIAGVELHPEGPVRARSWKGREPIGDGVTDPYIPMISYTEEQTEELTYGALRRILEECSVGRDFDIGLERIVRRGGDGKAEAVSASPNARDGARTTFEHADETHRYTLDSLKRAWSVMLANLAKRPIADPWALETTTAPEPGMGSTAESTMQYAQTMAEKSEKGAKARLFFFHRQASDKHDLDTEVGLKAAVIEASGPYIAKWSAIDRIVETFRAPDADRAYLERVWLNRPVQASGMAFDVDQWRSLARPGYVVPDGAAITIGFDGGRFDDATGLVGTEIKTGFQWKLGAWERPLQLPDWEVPHGEVDGIVSDAFQRWTVVRFYGDPPQWESWLATWASRYGDKRVFEWWTNRRKPMAYALRSYVGAMTAGELEQSGDKQFETHIANARRSYTTLVDEKGVTLWILRKERPDSPNKIDLAMAGCLSWVARNDALAAGEVGGEPFLTFLSFAGRP